MLNEKTGHVLYFIKESSREKQEQGTFSLFVFERNLRFMYLVF
jgi:hypothetical protein